VLDMLMCVAMFDGVDVLMCKVDVLDMLMCVAVFDVLMCLQRLVCITPHRKKTFNQSVNRKVEVGVCVNCVFPFQIFDKDHFSDEDAVAVSAAVEVVEVPIIQEPKKIIGNFPVEEM